MDATVYSKLREQGSKMQLICLHSKREDIQTLAETTQPVAMSHHGGTTDRLFGEGRSGQVHDFLKAVHDHGLLAGVSAHNPDCIKRVADEGWEVDFFMTCFYYLTGPTLGRAEPEPPGTRRSEGHLHVLSRRSGGDVPGYPAGETTLPGVQDPRGRAARASQDMVREAFEFAFRRSSLRMR